MKPIVVEVVRGQIVEARHAAHAVAVRHGTIEESAGDAHFFTAFRSSAKPIQALPVIRSRPDLEEVEIAIACASHLARPEQLDGGSVATRAMRAFPELIRAPGAADTELMRALPGWTAKGGAEALLCAASPDGLGVAVKVEDGGGRAVRTATAAFLGRLGLDPGPLAEVPLENSRGETVGLIRAS